MPPPGWKGRNFTLWIAILKNREVNLVLNGKPEIP